MEAVLENALVERYGKADSKTCEQVDSLTFDGPTPSQPLKDHLPNLQHVYFYGCDHVDLSIVDGLTLKTVKASNSRLRDLSPLRGRFIVGVDVTCCLVQDLSPLLEAPPEDLHYHGNPLTEHSYREVIPELVRRDTWLFEEEKMTDTEFHLMRAFVDRGLELSAFHGFQGNVRLIQPGSKHRLERLIILPAEVLWQLLEEHPDADTDAFVEIGMARYHEMVEGGWK